MTMLDAVTHIFEQSGWGAREVLTLENVTVGDIELMLRTLDDEKFQMLMARMLQMRIQKNLYDSHFGGITDKFVSACRNIVLDPNSGRLGLIIKRQFFRVSLRDEVEPPASHCDGPATDDVVANS
jgi:hypothetical protein